jgi:hypothetical protein
MPEPHDVEALFREALLIMIEPHQQLGLAGIRHGRRMGLEALLLQTRGGVWSENTKSRSTESRGMSRTNMLIAVPPLSANVSSTSTSGATRVSSRALSR